MIVVVVAMNEALFFSFLKKKIFSPQTCAPDFGMFHA